MEKFLLHKVYLRYFYILPTLFYFIFITGCNKTDNKDQEAKIKQLEDSLKIVNLSKKIDQDSIKRLVESKKEAETSNHENKNNVPEKRPSDQRVIGDLKSRNGYQILKDIKIVGQNEKDGIITFQVTAYTTMKDGSVGGFHVGDTGNCRFEISYSQFGDDWQIKNSRRIDCE